MAENADNCPLWAGGALRLVVVEVSVYSLRAILKVAYNLTGRAFIHLQYRDEKAVEIRIRAKDSAADVDWIVGYFLNDLIDQRLCEMVGRETEATRDLILAHALSQTNLLHPQLETAVPSADPLRIARPDVAAQPAV